MINIGNLLDACRISYTDKQLTKLDKLVKDLLKKLSLHKLDSNKTIQNDSIPDYQDKSRNEDFPDKTEIKLSQDCIQEFHFEPVSQSNSTIKEEITRESEIEIKEEFPKDPFASLETSNKCQDSSDKVYEKNVESIDSSGLIPADVVEDNSTPESPLDIDIPEDDDIMPSNIR
jgi:hypothetical protein